jgi:LCCL domain
MTRSPRLLAGALLALLPLVAAGPCHGQAGPGQVDPKPGKPVEPGAVEARFADGSTLKLTLKDEKLELTTAYGKLSIPVADVRRIDFGTRIPDDVAKKVDAAIANLASDNFQTREDASALLLKLAEKAYPALLENSKKKSDAEVKRRVETILEKIRATAPAELLEVRNADVVYTVDSKITGHLEGEAFKATTTLFGDVRMKLADVRSLRSLAGEPEQEVVNAQPDPGTLLNLQGEIGKVFHFRVTGAVNGAVWGTGVYTSDSTLATAAVHAGILQPGQTGVVKVRIVVPPPAFTGTTSNGVTTSDYGPFQGAYEIIR